MRVLDPSERIAEVLFGLIMVRTFMGSLSAAEAGRCALALGERSRRVDVALGGEAGSAHEGTRA